MSSGRSRECRERAAKNLHFSSTSHTVAGGTIDRRSPVRKSLSLTTPCLKGLLRPSRSERDERACALRSDEYHLVSRTSYGFLFLFVCCRAGCRGRDGPASAFTSRQLNESGPWCSPCRELTAELDATALCSGGLASPSSMRRMQPLVLSGSSCDFGSQGGCNNNLRA